MKRLVSVVIVVALLLMPTSVFATDGIKGNGLSGGSFARVVGDAGIVTLASGRVYYKTETSHPKPVTQTFTKAQAANERAFNNAVRSLVLGSILIGLPPVVNILVNAFVSYLVTFIPVKERVGTYKGTRWLVKYVKVDSRTGKKTVVKTGVKIILKKGKQTFTTTKWGPQGTVK